MDNGVRLGRLADVEIWIDWSLLIIFSLILLALGWGLLPAWHPDWAAGLRWSVALTAAVLFFVSVLLHELAHALVGRARGATVPRITLFIFGGMAHMEDEPKGWRDELWMTLVGPLTSLGLGVLCLLAGNALAGDTELAAEDAGAFLAGLSPAATLLLWLGQVNIVLGVFNLIPGYPLDGGRVLRALLWGWTGDRQRATQRAAGLGQLFAWLLIAAGFAMILGIRLPIFGTGLIGGLWLAFIGWFLNNAAVRGYRQELVQNSLGKVPVQRLMLTSFYRVAPEMELDQLLEEGVIGAGQRAFPVMEGDSLLGLVSLADLQRIPARARVGRAVATVMTPREKLVTVELTDDASHALTRLTRAQVNQLPVLDGPRLVGLITRENLMRWLVLEGLGQRKPAEDPLDQG